MPENINCIMSEDGETCLTHVCNAHEHCMKQGCPHCDVDKNQYHKNKEFADKLEEISKKLHLTNQYLKDKDAGEVK